MRKIFALLMITAVLFGSVFSLPANAAYDEQLEELEPYAECLLLMSMDNGEVIFDKNAGKQTPPASLTKVVTALVTLENCADPHATTVTVPEKCIDELSGTGSSMGGLKPGEVMSVYDLLACMLIKSANEAATTLADYISGGDREKFITMMNELAKSVGCEDSNFTNPHGLHDEDQYVTAEDMATLFCYAMEFPVFEEIVGKSSHMLAATNMQGERKITNTNFLMNSGYKDYYCEYVTGGKTGSTEAAGRCVVATASNNGYNYVCVVLNSIFEDVDKDGVEENGAFLDAKEVFEWTFKNIELVAISDVNRIVYQVPVKFGYSHGESIDALTLCPGETVYSLVPKGTDSGSLLVEPIKDTVPAELKAPIKKGDVICRAKVLYAGNVIKEIDLVASKDVDYPPLLVVGIIAGIIVPAAAIVLFVMIILQLRRRRAQNSRYSGSKNYKVLNYNDFTKTR